MNQITPIIDFGSELAKPFGLDGKVAYLPGGYGGLGEAIAWSLALAGARVVVSGRSQDKAEALAGAASRCICSRCAPSSACATAVIRPTAAPRARWSC